MWFCYNKGKGFSLIELMVAIGIGTTMMAAITTNYSQLSQFFVALKHNSSRLMEVNRAQKLLQADKDPGSLSGGIFETKVPIDRDVNGDGVLDGTVTPGNIFNPMVLAVEAGGAPIDPVNLPADGNSYVKRILMLQSIKDYQVETIASDSASLILKGTFNEPTNPQPPYAALLVNSVANDRFFNERQGILAKRQHRNFSFLQITAVATAADGRSTLTLGPATVTDVSSFVNLEGLDSTAIKNVFGFDFINPQNSALENPALANDLSISGDGGGANGIPAAPSMYFSQPNIYGPADNDGPFITASRENLYAARKDEVQTLAAAAQPFANTGPILHRIQIVEYLVVPTNLSVTNPELIGPNRDQPVYYRNIYRSTYPCPAPNIPLPAADIAPAFAGISYGCNLTLVLANASLSEFDVAIDGSAGYNRGVNVSFGFKPRGFRTAGKMRPDDQNAGHKMGVLRNIAPTKRLAPKFRKSALESNPDLNKTEVDEVTPLPCNYYKGQVLSEENNLMGVQFPRICTGRSNSGVSAEIEEAVKSGSSTVTGFNLADLSYMNTQATRPADIVFMLDMTASMRPYWDGLRDYLQGFLQQLSEETKLSFILHIRGFQDGVNELGRNILPPKSPVFTPTAFPDLSLYVQGPQSFNAILSGSLDMDFNFVPTCPVGSTPRAIKTAKTVFFNMIDENILPKGGDTPENPAYAMANALGTNLANNGTIQVSGITLGTGITSHTGTYPSAADISAFTTDPTTGAPPFGRLVLNLLPQAVKASYGYPSLPFSPDPGTDLYSVIPHNYFTDGAGFLRRKNTTIMVLISDTYPQNKALIERNRNSAAVPDRCNSTFLEQGGMTEDIIRYFSYGNFHDSTPVARPAAFNWADTQLGNEWINNLLFYYIVPAARIKCDDATWMKDLTPATWDANDPYWIHPDTNYPRPRDDQALYIKTDPDYDPEFFSGWKADRKVLLKGTSFDPNGVLPIQPGTVMTNSLRDQLQQTSWGNISGVSALGNSAETSPPTADGFQTAEINALPLLEKTIFEDVFKFYNYNNTPAVCGNDVGSDTCWKNFIKVLFGIQLRNLIDRVKERLDPTAKTCHLFGDFNIIAWPVMKGDYRLAGGTRYCQKLGVLNNAIAYQDDPVPGQAGMFKPCVGLRSATDPFKFGKPLGFVHMGQAIPATNLNSINLSANYSSGFFHRLFIDAANQGRVTTTTDFVAFSQTGIPNITPFGTPNTSRISTYIASGAPPTFTQATGYLNDFLTKVQILTEQTKLNQIYPNAVAEPDFAVLEFQMLYCCQSGEQGTPFDPLINQASGADLHDGMGKCSMQKISKFVGVGSPPDNFEWNIRYPDIDQPLCDPD